MAELPFNPTQLLSMLTGALNFINTNTRNSLPCIITTNYLTPYSFHKATKNYYFSPYNSSLAGEQTLLGLACYKAFEASKNFSWQTLGNNITQSFVDYFFLSDVPTNTNTLWLNNWLNVAYGSVRSEGDQTEENPFNFGNFDTSITFNNGLGTIANASSLSRVFKVYSGDLDFKNVLASSSSLEYAMEYYVINWNLENVNYRVRNNQIAETTNEQPGTVKLISNFTGQSKITWCQYSTVVNAATAVRSGQGLIDSYPMLYDTNRGGGKYFITSNFRSFYNGYSLFKKAFEITSNEKWQRALNAYKYTALQLSSIDNTSFFYKKENYNNVFRYPGTRVKLNGSASLDSSVTVTRETGNLLKNFLKINVASNSSNRIIEFENNITLCNVANNTKINTEIYSSVTTQLEFTLNNSVSGSDSYSAYRIITANSLNNISLNTSDFIKWSNNTWKFSDTLNISVTADGSITASNIQSIVNATNTIVKRLMFNKGLTGSAIATLQNIGYGSVLPKIAYSLTGNVSIKLKDSSNNQYSLQLPVTNGQWLELQLDLTYFPGFTGSVSEIAFEVLEGVATLDIYYVGEEPVLMSSGTVYKASIIDKEASSHILWIGTFKADFNSLETITNPGCVPFSKQTFLSSGTALETNNQTGLLYSAYQSPYHFYLFGDSLKASQQLNFIYDSYLNSNSPLFVPAYWDSASYKTYGSKSTVSETLGSFKRAGSAVSSLNQKTLSTTTNTTVYNFNEFSFQGFDPRSTDFLELARTIESVSLYLMQFKRDEKSKTLVTTFLNKINALYTSRNSIQPPTDFNALEVQFNYHNPAVAAVIGRISLNANLTGIDPELTINLIKNSFDYIFSQYVDSGLMLGSWSKNQANVSINGSVYKEYFNHYHSETILFISELFINRNILKYPYSVESQIFPEIIPDFIDNFKSGEYKNNTLKFTDNEQVLILSDREYNTEITLKYNLINAEKLDILLKFWQQQGKTSSFELPVTIWKHPSIVTSAINPSLARWIFKDNISFNVRVANKERSLYKLEITLKQLLGLDKSYNLNLSNNTPNFDPDPPIPAKPGDYTGLYKWNVSTARNPRNTLNDLVFITQGKITDYKVTGVINYDTTVSPPATNWGISFKSNGVLVTGSAVGTGIDSDRPKLVFARVDNLPDSNGQVLNIVSEGEI